ncbi:type VI secretion system baseplate subunit TssG [Erwiniaceae bacterium L1_54_6]|jgi:type VI secretion system protein ImpH|uniref:Type VI secretion system baseplate subunit TssG n=1 Tax=Pantoea cypripedii TaxID=55209 RepID=A0A6B9FZH5_PANCY|nr:type VI secretion system baseplate subunit TssG [Pantoea cypripedii]MDF7659595.1 type VI secretion system baseplate subunit TssG [Erwiniaceae bacterium L1_54_6]QGY29702.1 type VI secretion system baseplate subunit TssG [Pantoea cypripedii]
MSEVAQVIPLQRASRLPDDFWQAVMAAPWRYDLFQLLRRLNAQSGQRYSLGRAPLPKFEAVRLGQTPSLAFAPATLAKVSEREEDGRHDVSIYSFGLFGPNGPLPTHLTEYVRDRIVHHQDHSLSAFADLFHHRATLLFYRAWADAQPTASLDRGDDKRFQDYLACLAGIGFPAQQQASSLSLHARLMLVGHLSRHGHDAEGLERILRLYFGVPVMLDQNVPQWLTLDHRDQARLGAGRQMPRLGESAFLGVAVRDVQHRFRLRFGPLTAGQYAHFLPDGKGACEVRDWVRHYLGIEMQWDLSLILAAADVKGVTLGGEARLGYTSWLGQPDQPVDREDFVFEVEAASR